MQNKIEPPDKERQEILIRAIKSQGSNDDVIEEVLEIAMNEGDPERRELLKKNYLIIKISL